MHKPTLQFPNISRGNGRLEALSLNKACLKFSQYEKGRKPKIKANPGDTGIINERGLEAK